MHSPADLADAVAAQIRAAEDALRREQAVYGIDARSELQLHELIQSGLQSAGFGVFSEQRYPGVRTHKKKKSEGERCDVVVTLDERPLRQPDVLGTLFDPADACDLDEAYWLEIKVVNQFTPEGVNRSYSSDLLSTVRQDVMKLSREQGILRAGVLILLFVADNRIAENDLRIWEQRCLELGLPIEPPVRRDVPILDRHGNALCALALYPVRHL